MSLGSLILKLRLRYRHGLRVAWWRDVVRPRILASAPVTDTNDSRCEIHVLTSADDWLNLIWALKSFYRYSEAAFSLCIHEDGTLGPEQTDALRKHFPQARVVSKSAADAIVFDRLAGFPRSARLRRWNPLSLKIFDFAMFLESERMLLLDCDVLFFARPCELLRRIEDPAWKLNSVNRDLNSAYTVEPQQVRERFGIELVPRFNSGLGLIHRDSLRLDWIEEFLDLPGILSHEWQIEQTLFALCSSRSGVELLPGEYDVALGDREPSRPCRHYVGEIRHLLYREGLRDLVRSGFLHSERAVGRRRPTAVSESA